MKIDLEVLQRGYGKPAPLYRQLKHLLRTAIENGIYQPGERLAPERKFMAAGNLSYPTVARAFSELAEEGLLVRRVGSGTFVNPQRHWQITKPRRVAVFYYNTQTPYFDALFAGIEIECRRHGIAAIPHATGLSSRQEAQIVHRLENSHVDGIIGLPVGSLSLVQDLNTMIQRGFPVVLAGRYFDELKCDAVTTDNESGGYQAAKHLLELGHRRIAYMGTLPRYPFNTIQTEIQSGIKRAMAENSNNSLTLKPLLMPVGVDEESAEERLRLRQIFSDPDKKRPTGIICEGDGLAKYLYRFLKKNGFSIPDDVSVIGFGNLSTAEEIVPNLTSINWPLERLGAYTVRRFIERARHPAHTPVHIILETRLVVRKSTAPVPEGTSPCRAGNLFN